MTLKREKQREKRVPPLHGENIWNCDRRFVLPVHREPLSEDKPWPEDSSRLLGIAIRAGVLDADFFTGPPVV